MGLGLYKRRKQRVANLTKRKKGGKTWLEENNYILTYISIFN